MQVNQDVIVWQGLTTPVNDQRCFCGPWMRSVTMGQKAYGRIAPEKIPQLLRRLLRGSVNHQSPALANRTATKSGHLKRLVLHIEKKFYSGHEPIISRRAA